MARLLISCMRLYDVPCDVPCRQTMVQLQEALRKSPAGGIPTLCVKDSSSATWNGLQAKGIEIPACDLQADCGAMAGCAEVGPGATGG